MTQGVFLFEKHFGKWYPHAYSSVVREVERAKKTHIEVVVSEDLRTVKQGYVTRAGTTTIFLPDVRTDVASTKTFLERRTHELVAMLVLGYELGSLYYDPKKASSPLLTQDIFARYFSVRAAEFAELFVFDSEAARRVVKLFANRPWAWELYTQYRAHIQKQPLLRFAVNAGGLSHGQVYDVLRHAHRYCSLYLSLVADEEKIFSFVSGKHPQMLSLGRVSVSSPGFFSLTLRKTGSFLSRHLVLLRRSLKTLPFFDEYIRHEEAKLRAETAEFKARETAAKLRNDILKFQTKEWREYKKRLHMPNAIDRIENKEEVMNKLIESAEVLRKSQVNIID